MLQSSFRGCEWNASAGTEPDTGRSASAGARAELQTGAMLLLDENGEEGEMCVLCCAPGCTYPS